MGDVDIKQLCPNHNSDSAASDEDDPRAMWVVLSCLAGVLVCLMGCCVGLCYLKCQKDDSLDVHEAERRKSEELQKQRSSMTVNSSLGGVVPTSQMTATAVGMPVSPGPPRTAWEEESGKP